MGDRVTVAVDANGADRGPAEVAAGAALAAERGTRVLLFGPAREIGDVPGVEVVDAPLCVAKAAEPTRAVRASPEASIVLAARAVAEGRADALVSAGSTGATVAAGVLHLRRARGVHRPAIAVTIPLPAGEALLLDAGASVEARPEHLVQFALMGSAFVRAVKGSDHVRVGLLSNGSEAERGTAAVVEAHAQLSRRLRDVPGIDFAGNIEATALLEGGVDVAVADGFTGNVALKAIEGTSTVLLSAVRDVASASVRGRLGGLALAPALRRLRDLLDPERTGGAHLLGLRHLVVVAHGRFGRDGFARAIAVAERGAREGVVERTREALEAAGALRRAPSEAGASVPVVR